MNKTHIITLRLRGGSNVPLVHIPTKRTDEVDFTDPFKEYILSNYQEDASNYAAEISALTRLRQDTRGAGKDQTGRDILYRCKFFNDITRLWPTGTFRSTISY